MRSREELSPGTGKVEQFLSDLAVNGQVAASTQNQAFNALLFLYREVLRQPFENIQAVRANRPVRVPVVLTAEEVKSAAGRWQQAAVLRPIKITIPITIKMPLREGNRPQS